ncbi:Ig-like domain-containing protein, partial [Pseudomonas zeae]|uniref:Ig-like domain-containing protein n=1 Tax=Pseudomonas zeae TaxID=2745510 RepID=UPI0039E07F50
TVLADASYTVQARVIDTAGNRSPLVTQTVTVDTSLPSAGIIPVFGSITLDLGISASDFITLDRTLLFNGTLTAPLSGDETLQFSLDGGATWSATTVSGTNWTYDNTGVSLANNTYLAQLRVIDSAGNIGQSAQQTVVIYSAVPVGTASVTGITLDSGTSATDFSTSDQTLVFSLTLAGVLGSNEFVQISLDAGSTWHDATLSSGSTYVYDHTANILADGVYTLQARVFDVAGNSSAVATQILQIDTSAPSTGNAVAITTYTDLVPLQTGNFGSGTVTNDPAPKLNGTVSGLNANDSVQVYEGTTLLGLATVTGGTWTYQLAATADGSHTYHVVIADAAGNQGTASSDFSVTVDTQGPSASTTLSITSINADTGIGSDFITSDNTL